uniref:Uncharacterized protein n=1 Tax=Picea sitchensis TaxID=3332 RepID=A0A6B9XUC7_PICSI|nr:hypothetical protein Q903MT_gene3877 [Picea sitchensis]
MLTALNSLHISTKLLSYMLLNEITPLLLYISIKLKVMPSSITYSTCTELSKIANTRAYFCLIY